MCRFLCAWVCACTYVCIPVEARSQPRVPCLGCSLLSCCWCSALFLRQNVSLAWYPPGIPQEIWPSNPKNPPSTTVTSAPSCGGLFKKIICGLWEIVPVFARLTTTLPATLSTQVCLATFLPHKSLWLANATTCAVQIEGKASL